MVEFPFLKLDNVLEKWSGAHSQIQEHFFLKTAMFAGMSCTAKFVFKTALVTGPYGP
jgi:hypothetical protein